MASLDSSASLRRLRISSPGASNVYFRHNISQRPFSHGEMMAILALAEDPKAFGEKLVAMSQKWEPNGFNLATEFVATLEDYTSRIIPKVDIPSILAAIFDVGDELWCHEKEMPRILGFGAHNYIMRVIYQLARRLSELERFEAYRSAFSEGRALATVCREARALAGQHGRNRVGSIKPEESRELSPVHEADIERLVLGRIRTFAENGSLLDSKMPAPLYFWEGIEGAHAARDWVNRYIKDDKGLVRILETFLGFERDMTGERKDPRLPLDSLIKFTDPKQIIDRARAIADANWLTDMQRTAVSQFVKEYDEQVKSGKEPDNPVEAQPE